ncbi:pentatricopeptide repeat-containing protein At4g38010-like [Pistacia vera]|uniref:pentatricopeptide repeat-containing protein At4g38010-like n=1 Tax=Pistacia vera TaxID=55513 RepID=UPI0012639FFE|nr:pentatricopeptide repeat-containing protein At4g38010-like [Pistacia vera]
MIATGLIQYPPAASKLVAAFAVSTVFGATSTARSIAERVRGLDSYTWNTIIRGYLEENKPKNAFLVYSCMRKKALQVDTYTLMFVTKACGLISLTLGEQIHVQICKLGFESEIIIQTALLKVYASFGELSDMDQLFDEMPYRDMVTWNSLIAVYAQHSSHFKVLELLRAMVYNGLRPNESTAVSMLSAFSSLKALREGKVVHCFAVRNFVNLDVFVYNALIGMYSKCGNLPYALRIFKLMPVRSVVSWTSMINGYCDNNFPNEALDLFKQMESKGVKPDEITMLSVVSICSKLGSFELGEWIDQYVEKSGFAKGSLSIANALINMHAKCGNIEKACQIFDGIPEKTLVSWTSIIHGLAVHGQGILALVRFSQMLREGFQPDGIVFLSILSACSYAGLVDEGRKCFDSMIKDYHLEPWQEHYTCMVDLLCRAGLINEAFKFVVNMPVEPDPIMLRILLRACQNQGDIDTASRIMNYLYQLCPKRSEDYLLISNLYATVSKWAAAAEVRDQMKFRGLINRNPGRSSIEMSNLYKDFCEVFPGEPLPKPEDDTRTSAKFSIKILLWHKFKPLYLEEIEVVNILHSHRTFEVEQDRFIYNNDTSKSTIEAMLSTMSIPVKASLVKEILSYVKEMTKNNIYARYKIPSMHVHIGIIVDKPAEVPRDYGVTDLKQNSSSILEIVKVEASNEAPTCAICLEEVVFGSLATRMPCSHVFHSGCIGHWLSKNEVCPLCRFEMI